MKFRDRIREHETRTRAAKAMGGEDKLARHRQSGVMNARERSDYPNRPACACPTSWARGWE